MLGVGARSAFTPNLSFGRRKKLKSAKVEPVHAYITPSLASYYGSFQMACAHPWRGCDNDREVSSDPNLPAPTAIFNVETRAVRLDWLILFFISFALRGSYSKSLYYSGHSRLLPVSAQSQLLRSIKRPVSSSTPCLASPGLAWPLFSSLVLDSQFVPIRSNSIQQSNHTPAANSRPR